MLKEITMRQAGGSLTATLPKDMADRMNLKAHDKVFAIETPDGVLLTPYDPKFAQAMEVYERGARKYRNALRQLAE